MVGAGLSDYSEFQCQNLLDFLVGWIKFGKKGGVKYDFYVLS